MCSSARKFENLLRRQKEREREQFNGNRIVTQENVEIIVRKQK